MKVTVDKLGVMEWVGTTREAILAHKHCPTCGAAYLPVQADIECRSCTARIPK